MLIAALLFRRLRAVFDDLLKKSLTSVDKLATIAEALRNAKIFEKPLSRAVDYAYAQKIPIFPIYEKFIESVEYEDYKERSHLVFPQVTYISSKVSHILEFYVFIGFFLDSKIIISNYF